MDGCQTVSWEAKLKPLLASIWPYACVLSQASFERIPPYLLKNPSRRMGFESPGQALQWDLDGTS